MHSAWYLPELLVHIVLYLDIDDAARCYHVSRHWRATLKNNLCPYQRLLPDPNFNTKPSCKSLPQHISALAASIQAGNCHWVSLPLPELDDHYSFWRTTVFESLLNALKPQLHPFLAGSVCRLLDGVDVLVEGKTGVCLRTQCVMKDFLKLQDTFDNVSVQLSGLQTKSKRQFDDKHSTETTTRRGVEAADPDSQLSYYTAFLTQPPIRNVELYCPQGALWDHPNNSVLYRQEGAGWSAHCIRVEREKGVRLCDVLDELRGVLVPSRGFPTESMLALEWQFDQVRYGKS
jgi:hypothetical protein